MLWYLVYRPKIRTNPLSQLGHLPLQGQVPEPQTTKTLLEIIRRRLAFLFPENVQTYLPNICILIYRKAYIVIYRLQKLVYPFPH
jgi:hypothetical protein